jgi:hypothetical protein
LCEGIETWLSFHGSAMLPEPGAELLRVALFDGQLAIAFYDVLAIDRDRRAKVTIVPKRRIARAR